METAKLPNLSTAPANSYAGVALLGWMEKSQAIRFLIEDCWFESALTEAAAESLWREWRDRAAALPEREAPAPEPVPLTAEENAHAARFLQFVGALGLSGVEVVKIDPMLLVAGQYHIAIDVAAAHAEGCAEHSAWMERTLPTSSSNPQLSMNFMRRNMDTEVLIDLPHGEFIFGVHPHGGFGPKELLGHVMVARAGKRFLLGKGYHRLYARISNTGAALPERLSLVALESSVLTPPAGTGNSGSQGDGLDIFGARPALFADFFTEGLAIPVYLRKKHYQLQIQARWVALDEPL
ncbi:MAG TPA: hypothetical protein VK670_02840 [Silvibacterium sp.]|nr:hypothetical protein [Silvibacterium sp.]